MDQDIASQAAALQAAYRRSAPGLRQIHIPLAGFIRTDVDCPEHGVQRNVIAPAHLAERPEMCPKCADRAREQAVLDDDAEFHRMHRQRVAEHAMGGACVPPRFLLATLAETPPEPEHEVVMQSLRKYAANWPAVKASGASIVLHGIRGTGKSRMAAALVRAVLDAGDTAGFIRQDELSDMIRATHGPAATQTEKSVIDGVMRIRFLVLDELGVGKSTATEQQYVEKILLQRHEKMLPTLITSNLKPDEVLAYVGERVAERMNSWDWHDCPWPSFRTKAAYMNQESV